MTEQSTANRRKFLKGIGVGVLGSAAFTAPVSAKGKDKGNDYGNGNAIGTFLNEKALWNKKPRNGGVVDMTGMNEVDVYVGSITTINPPPNHEDTPGPFGFEPQAVEVTTGTDVTWNWIDYSPRETPHHSVTNYKPGAGDPEDPTTTGDHGDLFDEHGEGPHSFTYTFDESGTYLYFCHPHGTPYPAYDAFLENVPGVDPVQENLLGMRGAVKVTDDE